MALLIVIHFDNAVIDSKNHFCITIFQIARMSPDLGKGSANIDNKIPRL